MAVGTLNFHFLLSKVTLNVANEAGVMMITRVFMLVSNYVSHVVCAAIKIQLLLRLLPRHFAHCLCTPVSFALFSG